MHETVLVVATVISLITVAGMALGMKHENDVQRLMGDVWGAVEHDWLSGYEVATHLGTRNYGAVQAALHRLYARGNLIDRWDPSDDGLRRRRYHVRDARDWRGTDCGVFSCTDPSPCVHQQL